MRVWANAED